MSPSRFGIDSMVVTPRREASVQRWIAAIQIVGALIAMTFLILMLRPLL